MLIGSHFIRTGRQAPPPGQAFTAGNYRCFRSFLALRITAMSLA